MKINNQKKCRVHSLIIASAFCAVLVLFSSVPARGEAGADLLGRYTCTQLKALIETNPVKLFDIWLNSKKIAGNSKYASYLRKKIGFSGPYAAVLKYSNDVNILIEGLDEAVHGKAENIVKIFSKHFIKRVMADIGEGSAEGGVLGAVITIGSELYQFASDLDKEILDINVRNIAAAVMGEKLAAGYHPKKHPLRPNPRLLDEKYFLETYLGWDGNKFKRYNAFEKAAGMAARRSMIVDYAAYKLNWNVSGKKGSLKGWRLNEIRTVIHILLKDVRQIVEKKRKIQRLQGELKLRLAELKQQQAMLSSFNSLRSQVMAMTCNSDELPDANKDCMDAHSSAVDVINNMILERGSFTVILTESLEAFKDSINDLYGTLERKDSYLQETYKPEIQNYCDTANGSMMSVFYAIQQAESINADITAAETTAFANKDLACSAERTSVAQDSAKKAKAAAERAALLFKEFPSMPLYVDPGPPPAPMDFPGLKGQLSTLSMQAEEYQRVLKENSTKMDVLNRQARIARTQLHTMVSVCQGYPFNGESARMSAESLDKDIVKAESEVEDLKYQAAYVEGSTSKVDAIRWYLSSLQGQMESARACLDTLPDSEELFTKFEHLNEVGRSSVNDAKVYADLALTCYESSQEKISCDTNKDCPVGSMCSEGNICVAMDDNGGGENLFSVGSTEKINNSKNPFSVAGAETIPSQPPDTVDCSSIPGSTAVQGQCICIDGLILSPSQNRCLSCDDYYRRSKRAVDAGDFNAARAILSEAQECPSVVAQIQNQINSAIQQQSCAAIATNLQAACRADDVQTVRGLMGQANQMKCRISPSLWQTGVAVVEHSRKLEEQFAVQQEANLQRQNQATITNIMGALLGGLKAAQPVKAPPSHINPIPSIPDPFSTRSHPGLAPENLPTTGTGSRGGGDNSKEYNRILEQCRKGLKGLAMAYKENRYKSLSCEEIANYYAYDICPGWAIKCKKRR